MGAWGAGISSNDTYADAYYRFFELHDEGLSVSDASAKLISENRETIETYEDAPNFWYALAKAQWECKELTQDLRSKVENYVLSGEDIRIWKELDASVSALNARRKALDKFLIKIQSEKRSARKRKKKRFYDSLYQKGDCLVYSMDNGNYGGAFVLTDEQMTIAGLNYIAITTINKAEKPSVEDFKEASVYLRFAEKIYLQEGQVKSKWVDQAEISGYSTLTSKSIDFDIEVIGNIKMYKEFYPENVSWSNWIWLRTLLLTNDEYESLNGKPKSTLKLAKWIKKPSLFRFFG